MAIDHLRASRYAKYTAGDPQRHPLPSPHIDIRLDRNPRAIERGHREVGK